MFSPRVAVACANRRLMEASVPCMGMRERNSDEREDGKGRFLLAVRGEDVVGDQIDDLLARAVALI